MTVATDLLNPDIKKIFLAEITCGQHLTLWTLDTGTTYYATAIYNVINVQEDGADLTSRASIDLVDANAGSFFFDDANDRVYVHTTGSADAHTVTIQAFNEFYYANRDVILNGQYYEPRLDSVPNLSLRIEGKFSGIQQISGGSIRLVNGGGFFDEYKDLQWDAGSVVLKLGTELNDATRAYGDYQTIGTWLIDNWTMSNTAFSLTVSEYKVKIKKKIPFEFYDRVTYPNIEQEDIGKPIQIAYGIIRDAKPTLINISTRTFKLAGHAIHELETVYVLNQDTDSWEIKSFETTDLANAEFTLSASDWEYKQQVAVDFKGKEVSSNVVMDNASSIIEDILTTYLGETASINAASFTESYNRLAGGSIYQSDDLKTYRAIGLFIDEAEPAESWLEKINFSIGSYLFANTSGEFVYRIFWPSRSEGLTEFTTEQISNFSETTNNKEIYSKAKTNYDIRYVREWAEWKSRERTESQYIHDEKSVKITEKDTVLYDSDDAETHAERTINYEGKPYKTYNMTVPGRNALLLSPGDAVKVIYERYNIDGVYEILHISHDLLGNKTTMMLGDSHGLKDSSGFWVDASDVLPVRFANEAGYNGGVLPWSDSWSDAISTWAIQNVGYWTDSNGYASSTDSRSRRKSTWI